MLMGTSEARDKIPLGGFCSLALVNFPYHIWELWMKTGRYGLVCAWSVLTNRYWVTLMSDTFNGLFYTGLECLIYSVCVFLQDGWRQQFCRKFRSCSAFKTVVYCTKVCKRTRAQTSSLAHRYNEQFIRRRCSSFIRKINTTKSNRDVSLVSLPSERLNISFIQLASGK